MKNPSSLKIERDGAPTRSVSQSKSLRKAVDALAIVPTKQRIYPLARKLYNVLLYLAQRQGFDKPIYRATLSELTGNAKFNSKDGALIKNHLRQMNSVQVEWQSPTAGEGSRWDVSNLISHATIKNSGRGSPVIFEWSFAPNIKDELLDPNRFAQISLAFQAALRSHASIALYEICSRYVDNPGHLTARNPWAWWRPVLTGIPELDATTYLQYKYFKRDVLNRSIAEINKITDLQIELIEHKEGRTVRDVQFAVTRRVDPVLSAEDRPVLNLELIGRAVRLGVSQMSAENLQQRYGDTPLADALQVLADRINAPKGAPIENPDKYLTRVVTRLASEPKNAPSISGLTPIKSGPNREQLEADFRDQRRREGRALYADMDEREQDMIRAAFETEFVHSSAAVIRRAYKKGGLDSPPIRAEFGAWHARRIWGDNWGTASAEELLRLVVGAQV